MISAQQKEYQYGRWGAYSIPRGAAGTTEAREKRTGPTLKAQLKEELVSLYPTGISSTLWWKAFAEEAYSMATHLKWSPPPRIPTKPTPKHQNIKTNRKVAKQAKRMGMTE